MSVRAFIARLLELVRRRRSGARTLAWDDRHDATTPAAWDVPGKRWNGER